MISNRSVSSSNERASPSRSHASMVMEKGSPSKRVTSSGRSSTGAVLTISNISVMG